MGSSSPVGYAPRLTVTERDGFTVCRRLCLSASQALSLSRLMPRRLRGAQARAPVGEVCSSMGFCTWGRISALSAVSRRECERLSEPSGSCNVRMKIRGSVSGPFSTSGEPPVNVSENQCPWGEGSPGPTVASSGWQVNELADCWRRSDGVAWSHRLLSVIVLFSAQQQAPSQAWGWSKSVMWSISFDMSCLASGTLAGIRNVSGSVAMARIRSGWRSG